MQRLPVPELEDFPWWPVPLRDAMTGFLRTASEVLRVSAQAAPVLEEALAASSVPRLVDLCSGGGGPVLSVAKRLRQGRFRDLSVVLTDKYPNEAAFARAERELPLVVTARRESIDATAVPQELSGVRTMFNALHHLPPEVARAVLADAAEKRQPIVSFEFVERSAQGVMLVSTIPLAVAALTPFSRPSLGALALTYVVPVVPAATLWDGFASCLRAYSVREIEEMIRPLQRPGYRFRVQRERLPWSPLFLTSIVGLPGPG